MDGQVLGADLNCSESSRGSGLSLGLEDNFADGIIARRIVELAKAGERNPNLLREGALEELRGQLYGD